MNNKKIFILIPDGLGLRNFAYTSFYENALKNEFEIVFWNNTSFPISELGFQELKTEIPKPHPLTDVYKNAKVHVEFNLNIKKTKDKVYNNYRFPFSYSNFKNSIKSIFVHLIILTHSSQKGLLRIRRKINESERKTFYYHQSLLTLKKEKPAMVFCTNQRHISTIAPLLAAKELGIPTAVCIFSWDNLPKAMLVVETDYYFVWSNHMKNELLFYYPYILPKQIFITGSLQFEIHYNKSKLFTREDFFIKYGLNLNKKYICFTGDDITTSPDDPNYLEDLALAIEKLNKRNFNLGIIFRRCPVDFSDRYNIVLKKYSHIIVSINPLWKPLSEAWNTILPTKEDGQLLSNIAEHSEMVVNIGSSTVFDFIAHKKPTGYFRYNQKKQLNNNWDIYKCYQFVHFRSMPSQKAVVWFDNPSDIAENIIEVLSKSQETINEAQLWFEKINQHPVEEASTRYLNAIQEIITNSESNK